MPASSSQYWSRSLPLTSALLPTDTKLDTPSPMRADRSRRAMPSAPDWDCMAMRPGVDAYGEKVASRPMAVLTTPRQLGPTSRMPLRRARSRSSACAATSPTSPNPALSTTTPATPFAAHWRTTSITAAAGTATTAKSTAPGMSSTVGYALTLATCSAPGLTGYTGPANPPASRLRRAWCPTVSGFRLAPITATDLGVSTRATDAASARCSRASAAARARSVGSISNSTCTMPPSMRVRSANPASRNTLSIWRLWASVSATNRVIPRSRAAAARCSSRTVPIPRPWCSSLTTNATSAESVPGARS